LLETKEKDTNKQTNKQKNEKELKNYMTETFFFYENKNKQNKDKKKI